MNKNNTLIDYAILGLIQNESHSGYRIRKVFEETALGSYSSSPGTIYPALKRLQNQELVESNMDDSTGKSSFQITNRGIEKLKQWLLKPIEKIEIEKKREALLLRFAFMDQLISKSQTMNFINSFHDLLSEYIDELHSYYAKEHQCLPLHGKLAFEHGISSCENTLKWCKKVQIELSKV